MNRRDFIRISLAGMGAFSLPEPTSAQTEQCGIFFDPMYGQIQKCVVGTGITSTPRQECQYWCWAACCEAIFGLAGLKVNQKRFVEKVFGGNLVCTTATGPMIYQAINGPWTDDRGNQAFANAQVQMDLSFGIQHPNPIGLIWSELNAGRSVITGALTHAVLITAMEYVRTPAGPQPLAIIVRDPWPESPNKRVMTIQEFYGTFLLMTLRLS